jgi:hypothetical protein
MTSQTHINDPKHAPHTLQSQLAAHFSEVAPSQTDGAKWQAVAFGRRLSDAHWLAEQDRKERARALGATALPSEQRKAPRI